MAFTFNARVWEGLKGFLDRDCRLIILSLVVNVVLGISKSLASFATAVPLNETMSYFFDKQSYALFHQDYVDQTDYRRNNP